jgi:hypothetical protein
MKKIGKRGKIKVKDGVVYLSLSNPVPMSFFYFCIVSIGSTLAFRLNFINNDLGIGWFSFLPECLFLTLFYFAMTSGSNAEIITKKRLVVVQSKILFVSYGKSGTVWPQDAALQYEIQYDSYKKITDVCLIAKRNSEGRKNDYIRLIHFSDLDTFKGFQSVFNEHFAAMAIKEWNE